MWTGSMSVAGRDGLIEDMAKRHLRILQTQIDGLWDNLIAKRGEFLEKYPLARRGAWKPAARGLRAVSFHLNSPRGPNRSN